MLQILAVTGPIYLRIGAGYLAVRFGLFAAAELRRLGRFAFRQGQVVEARCLASRWVVSTRHDVRLLNCLRPP